MDQDIPAAPISLDDIRVGMSASYSQTIGDFKLSSLRLSGDHNPVHLDNEFAENSRFKAYCSWDDFIIFFRFI